jgi:hypothetical protein
MYNKYFIYNILIIYLMKNSFKNISKYYKKIISKHNNIIFYYLKINNNKCNYNTQKLLKIINK